MLNERTRRRPDFLAGAPLRLADGQPWTLPAAEGGPLGPIGEGLVAAIREAEDEAELVRAELALAVALLGRNYALGPSEYRELLEAEPGSPAASDLRLALRQLGRDHVQAASAPAPTTPVPASLGRRLWARLAPA